VVVLRSRDAEEVSQAKIACFLLSLIKIYAQPGGGVVSVDLS
jgi:hypothetical protein